MRTDSGRTIIGSVVCVDLVGYSKRAVSQQILVKEAFNRLLAASIQAIPAEDRIILDTGDGVAITFLGDPEASFAVALRMRDTMNAAGAGLGAVEDGPRDRPIRIGIHLGPVRLAVDMNGRPNIIGDAINTAERIVAFAQPGEIVVSRAFHDMLSHISERHAAQFEPGGSHTDKNGRTHEIHRVRQAGAVPPPAARSGDPDAREMTQVSFPPRATARAAPAPPPASEENGPAIRIPAVLLARAMAASPDAGTEPAWIAFLRDGTRVAVTAVVLLAVIGAEAWWLAKRKPAPVATVASAPAAAPAPREVQSNVAAAPPAPARKVEPAKPEPAKRPEATKKPDPPKAVESAKKLDPPKPVEAAKAPEPAKKPEPARNEPLQPAAPGKAEPAKREEPKKADTTKPPPKREPPKPREEPKPPEPAPPVKPAEAPPPAPPPPAEAKRDEAPPAPPTTVATPVLRAPVAFPVGPQTRGLDSGRVRARVTIDAAGAVTGVSIIDSSGRAFDREATRSLESWKFNPGADNRTYEVQIEFKR